MSSADKTGLASTLGDTCVGITYQVLSHTKECGLSVSSGPHDRMAGGTTIHRADPDFPPKYMISDA